MDRRAPVSRRTRSRAAQRGAKRQPGGRLIRFGTLPGMTASSSSDVAHDRDRADQALRVRVQRLAEQRRDVGLLDDLAGVHDRDAVAHLGDHAQVVGDQDDRRAGLLAGGSRIRSRIWAWMVTSSAVVGSSAMSSSGSQASAIAIITRWAMPPRHLVRERLEAPLRVRDADHPQQLEGPLARGLAASSCGGSRAPRRSGGRRRRTGFSDEVGCWKIIEIRSPRSLRISSLGSLSRSSPSNMTSPASIAPGRRDEAHDRQRRHALAAARLADQAHDLAAVDRGSRCRSTARTDAVAGLERRAQALDLEQRPSPCSRPGRLRADAGTSSSMTVSSTRSARPRTSTPGDVPASSIEPRVERVAQAVAEQVEAEHGQREGDAREEDQVRAP